FTEADVSLRAERDCQTLDQRKGKLRHSDVFGRRELLAQPAGRTRRARLRVAQIALDENDAVGRTCAVDAQEIGDGATDDPTAHDNHIGTVHGRSMPEELAPLISSMTHSPVWSAMELGLPWELALTARAKWRSWLPTVDRPRRWSSPTSWNSAERS